MKLQDERGGLETGRKEGLEAGHKAGVVEGEKADRMATACALLADGIEAALVAKYTGLSQEDLRQL